MNGVNRVSRDFSSFTAEAAKLRQEQEAGTLEGRGIKRGSETRATEKLSDFFNQNSPGIEGSKKALGDVSITLDEAVAAREAVQAFLEENQDDVFGNQLEDYNAKLDVLIGQISLKKREQTEEIYEKFAVIDGMNINLENLKEKLENGSELSVKEQEYISHGKELIALLKEAPNLAEAKEFQNIQSIVKLEESAKASEKIMDLAFKEGSEVNPDTVLKKLQGKSTEKLTSKEAEYLKECLALHAKYKDQPDLLPPQVSRAIALVDKQIKSKIDSLRKSLAPTIFKKFPTHDVRDGFPIVSYSTLQKVKQKILEKLPIFEDLSTLEMPFETDEANALRDQNIAPQQFFDFLAQGVLIDSDRLDNVEYPSQPGCFIIKENADVRDDYSKTYPESTSFLEQSLIPSRATSQLEPIETRRADALKEFFNDLGRSPFVVRDITIPMGTPIATKAEILFSNMKEGFIRHLSSNPDNLVSELERNEHGKETVDPSLTEEQFLAEIGAVLDTSNIRDVKENVLNSIMAHSRLSPAQKEKFIQDLEHGGYNRAEIEGKVDAFLRVAMMRMLMIMSQRTAARFPKHLGSGSMSAFDYVLPSSDNQINSVGAGITIVAHSDMNSVTTIGRHQIVRIEDEALVGGFTITNEVSCAVPSRRDLHQTHERLVQLEDVRMSKDANQYTVNLIQGIYHPNMARYQGFLQRIRAFQWNEKLNAMTADDFVRTPENIEEVLGDKIGDFLNIAMDISKNEDVIKMYGEDPELEGLTENIGKIQQFNQKIQSMPPDQLQKIFQKQLEKLHDSFVKTTATSIHFDQDGNTDISFDQLDQADTILMENFPWIQHLSDPHKSEVSEQFIKTIFFGAAADQVKTINWEE